VFEKQRKIVMGARLMAVHGIIQRDEDSDVIHTRRAATEDHSHMLRHLSDEPFLRRYLREMLPEAGGRLLRGTRATSR
jgi:hypothetical protein